MKKIILFLALIIITLGILYALFVLFVQRSDKVIPQPPKDTSPVYPGKPAPFVPPQGSTIPVRTRSGNTVPVRDFRSDPLVASFNDHNNDPRYIYYILRDTDSPATASYEIQYTSSDGGIIVSLRKEPLRNTRLVAEESLVQHLGVSREKLCDLAISVVVARDVNEFHAGRQLGVSSCQGSQSL